VIALLRKYAINIIINALHKRQHELKRNHSFYLEQATATFSDEKIHAGELLQKYNDALATLPPKRRKVFILKKEQGLSHKQISDQLGISVFTIDRHMNEALRTLREKLSVDMLALIFVIRELHALVDRYY
jgi:RNA polymerase sigma-70 factor (ECF subfamily)